MAKCRECGFEIQEPNSTHRTPCPECGATARVFEEGIEEGVRVSCHVKLEALREGRTVGFRESQRDGRAASGDDSGNGCISMTLTGTSPQGEEDTLDACRGLVRALNCMGETWNEPMEGTAGVDCVATNATISTSSPLQIQVVRAIIDTRIWQALAATGTLTKSAMGVDEAANLLANALLKKLDPKRVPPKQRTTITLVLDATRLPALAFDSVVKRFRELHGDRLRTAGFRGIWIVGPTESLTKRLDFD